MFWRGRGGKLAERGWNAPDVGFTGTITALQGCCVSSSCCVSQNGRPAVQESCGHRLLENLGLVLPGDWRRGVARCTFLGSSDRQFLRPKRLNGNGHWQRVRGKFAPCCGGHPAKPPRNTSRSAVGAPLSRVRGETS